jgi:ribosome maturation factor RimP
VGPFAHFFVFMGDSVEQLRATAVRVAESHGLELFDLQFRRESTGWVLRVILDRVPGEPGRAGELGEPGDLGEPGIPGEPGEGAVTDALTDVVTIGDCQRVSHDLSALLDVEGDRLGLPDVAYTLEVSSPGLDRPLRGEADYRRFEGRLAKIVTTEPVERQSSFAGRLAGLEEGQVLLSEGRRLHRIPLARIKRARLDVEF